MNEKLEVVQKIRAILREHYDDPADQIIKEGTAMVEIGKALKGLSLAESRAIISAVAGLEMA